MADRIENIEDAQGRMFDTANEPLTDEQLETGGLVAVTAWVRSKASANALRQARKKKKQAEEGRAQVNVVVPEECKEPLKELAAALASGQITADDVRAMIAGADVVAELDSLKTEHDQMRQQAQAAQTELEAVRDELERMKAEAVAILTKSQEQAQTFKQRLRLAAEETHKAKTALHDQSRRHVEEQSAQRDRIEGLERIARELEAERDENARIHGIAAKSRDAEAMSLRDQLTAAAAERDSLRAALDAHTLRSRLARWLVGRV